MTMANRHFELAQLLRPDEKGKYQSTDSPIDDQTGMVFGFKMNLTTEILEDGQIGKLWLTCQLTVI